LVTWERGRLARIVGAKHILLHLQKNRILQAASNDFNKTLNQFGFTANEEENASVFCAAATIAKNETLWVYNTSH